MLKVHELTKIMGSHVILNKLSFEVKKGSVAIFLGPSGVGKSTLLRVLNHLEPVDSGSVSFEGDLLDLSTVNRSNTVGMVFQHFNLFEDLSVEDNIVLTLTACKGMHKNEARLKAGLLLKKYGLEDRATVPVSRLSGGQKQRLAIARTLSTDPKIICLDEPTSALDPHLTTQVAECIQDLVKENRIVLLTTHDMGLVSQLEGHLFLMEKGHVVESVLKCEYLANPPAYPKLEAFLKGAFKS